MSFLPRFFRIGALWLLFLAAGSVETGAADEIAPDAVPGGRMPTDRWAGRPVKDAPHVQGMVEGRMFNAPKVGEPAPPLTLVEARSGQAVSVLDLAKTKQKPVVLFFLSYSCHLSHNSVEPVRGLAQRFGSAVEFVLVYIQEAHPEGGFDALEGQRHLMIPAPASFSERVASAVRFGSESRLPFPMLVDSMDDAAAVRWGAWPVRLFVIDPAGKVVFAGQQGPWFHKPTRNYDTALVGTPEPYRNLPGYSRESLEEFLERFTNTKPAPESTPRLGPASER